MATKYGCAVHAFDCTMKDKHKLRDYLDRQKGVTNLSFHPWCIGNETKTIGEATVYDFEGGKGSFHSLDQIMKRLSHARLDILKFDIEGYEWDLFETIMQGNQLPTQMAFELHTQYANPNYVPSHLVAKKGRGAVAELFYELYLLGYRVVSKEVNNEDHGCAEFVVYRFGRLPNIVHGI